MASAVQQNFIETIAPMIQHEALARGYKVCSPIIAQATVESFKGTGLSQLASKFHNYFGMKCGSSWKGKSVNLATKEEVNGSMIGVQSNFRVYDSMLEGVRGYFDFISAKRYQNLKNATTPQQYLELIKADGYATSSVYVQSNLNRIALYNLTKYDPGKEIGGNPYPMPSTNLKIKSRGDGVKWLQYALKRFGFTLVIDGIFGPKTDEAVRAFQAERGLIVDGIVGPKTRAELIWI